MGHGTEDGSTRWRPGHFETARRVRKAADRADGCGRPGAADCLRECRQPPAGARGGAEKGNRAAPVAGCNPAADRSPVVDRQPAARPAGQHPGVLFAVWGERYMLLFLPPRLSESFSVAPNAAVLSFTACISIVSAIVFGLAPALRATDLDPATSLRGGASQAAGG